MGIFNFLLKTAGIDSYAAEVKTRADNGEAEAQFLLGGLHINGDGVPKDMAAAIIWTAKAAEQGHPKAQFNLGPFLFSRPRRSAGFHESIVLVSKSCGPRSC